MPDNHDSTLTPGKIVEGPPSALEAVPTKELRLAFVCYGGVSLAIYMHGVTKEIHKLVQASAAFENDQNRHPFASNDTAAIYWMLLKKLYDGKVPFQQISPTSGGKQVHKRDRVSTRVIVDTVAGTSAGGINRMFLAKAIAGNLSQDALKGFWLNRGDIRGLLAGPRLLPAWAKGVWFALKSPVSIVLRRDTPPLRGDEMCQWLHSAFTKMDETARAIDATWHRHGAVVREDIAIERIERGVVDIRGEDRFFEVVEDENAHRAAELDRPALRAQPASFID